ncbi:MAG: glycosyltransferase family 4 protein [Neisseriaceae bacterium]|nr:glycosyltransferase family 4 protein [Neisseriaceae bacterium]
MSKIVHLTSVHQRYDVRIFHKECVSLSHKWETDLIVADNKGDEVCQNIKIYDVGKENGRLNRIFKTTHKVYLKALQLDGDIYHLHDPELIPIGLKLLKNNKKVIFDAHEDVPKQILNKPYLKKWLAKILANFYQKYEHKSLKKFTGIITATPYIRDIFLQINNNTVDICNFPKLEEFNIRNIDKNQNKKNVCYIGGLTYVRGIQEIVEATQYLPSQIQLKIAGQFSESDFEQKIKSLPTWNNVDYLGFLNREEISQLLNQSFCGLVTLHPIPNYLDAYPVKMFEYMAMGLPVIASNIPLWKNIIDNEECGLCVNPNNPQEIANAIEFLFNNKDKAIQMGENGKKAILQKFNWEIEENKLFSFYGKLL